MYGIRNEFSTIFIARIKSTNDEEKGYAKGGMKKKGYAKGGMKKKGYAMGGLKTPSAESKRFKEIT